MLKMFYHNKIDVSEGIDINKSNKSSKECIMCIKSKERMYFKDIGYRYCNTECKRRDYRCVIWNLTKNGCS